MAATPHVPRLRTEALAPVRSADAPAPESPPHPAHPAPSSTPTATGTPPPEAPPAHTAPADTEPHGAAPATTAPTSTATPPPAKPTAAASPTEDAPSEPPAAGTEPAGWPRAILLLGFAGSVMMAVAAIGAGAILTRDPLLSSSPLAWVRYGHGRELATILLYGGMALLIWAWIRLGRSIRAGRLRLRAVFAAITVWTIPLLLSPPLFSKDIYSYLAQGDIALHGLDPYRIGPSALPGPLTDNVSWVWQNTPAPYGPVFVLLAKATVAITGQHLITGVVVMRLVMVPGLVMIMWALPKLAGHLGGRPAVALWLGAANPLILIHLVGGGHNDLLMLGLMMFGAMLVLQRRPVSGIAFVTLAVAVKASAVLLLPFLVWVWAGQLRGSAPARFTKAFLAALAVFGALFTGVTALAGVGLGWIPALSSSSAIVNWLSIPSGLGQLLDTMVGWFAHLPGNLFVIIFRDVGELLCAVLVVWQWWRARGGGPDAVRRSIFALLALAMLSPATLPWYFSWPLALGAALAYSGAGLVMVTAVSVWLVLVTYPSGDTALYDPLYIVVTAAVAVLAAVAVIRPDPLRFSVRSRDFLGARD